MLGVYIHIPFCRTRCPYCDFVSEAVDGAAPGSYVDALCQEIAAFEGPDAAGSIFFGGGTPSLLAPEDLGRLMDALAKRFSLHAPEVSLEANPDDVTGGLLDTWRAAGVNRVSLGVQSFDDAVLRYLGRRHDAAASARACRLVAERFGNWSMDLIFGAPPVEAWPRTLEQCRELAPPHVAAYGLTYEPGTPFGARAHEALEDDASLALYRAFEAALAAYDHYEISNFALPGHACRHNLVYWRNEEYAGFGTAAYGFVGNRRMRNALCTAEYLAAPGRKAECLALDDAEIRVETVIQHLRLREGLPKAYYRERFGQDIHAHFGAALGLLKARGLVEEDPTHLRPTREGFYLNNEIGLALV